MPKTTAPLLSFDARGQIGHSQVYSNWRGISYVRRYTKPSNPKTDGQTAVRDIFSMLNAAWLFAPTGLRAPWTAYAVGKPLLNRNAWIKFNGKVLATTPVAADLTGFYFSPGVGGGLPPASIALAPADGQITAIITPPAAPSGWTAAKVWAATIPNADPTAVFGGAWVTGSAAADPWTVVLAGLTNATEYIVGGWIEWTKPDGTTAYGVSIADMETPAP